MKVLYIGNCGDALAVIPDHATEDDIQNYIKQVVCDTLEREDRKSGVVKYTLCGTKEFTVIETSVMPVSPKKPDGRTYISADNLPSLDELMSDKPAEPAAPCTIREKVSPADRILDDLLSELDPTL